MLRFHEKMLKLAVSMQFNAAQETELIKKLKTYSVT